MVMKAYLKTVVRSLRSNAGRFVSVTIIIFLGIAFVACLGTLSPTVTQSYRNYLNEQTAPDLIVKSTSPQGFSEEEIESLKNRDGVACTQPLTAMEFKCDAGNTRVYILPVSRMQVNAIGLTAGRFPQNDKEVLVERASDTLRSYAVGDKIALFETEKTVVGIAANPLIFTMDGDSDLQNGEPLDTIVYLDSSTISMTLPVTDVYVQLESNGERALFTDGYHRQTARYAELLENDYGCAALTLTQNKSYAMWQSYSEKIDVICAIFPVFFIAVAALVVLTTMTRLVEEERTVIGCYKTLGYGDGKIVFKYAAFSVLSCLISSIVGLLVGIFLLPHAIFPAFSSELFMPALASTLHPVSGLWASLFMFLAVLGVTLFVAFQDVRCRPAEILRPKAPKAGRKIFLEKLPFLWNPLPFRFKSALRNLFRYKAHFIMTVVCVAGSTALVFAGFSLLNVSKGNGSIAMISAFIIAFALLLCVFVIYNLTNMNIGERRREIATLKVLGYRDGEVTGYIYREIFIMAFIGALLGIPLGCALVGFVFAYLDYGSLADIKWWSFVLSAAVVLVFIGLVDLLLSHKIRAVDMTSSLKSID